MPDVPEWFDLDREPEDKLPDQHNPPYMQTGRMFPGWLAPRIQRNAELDRQMDAWVKQFFRLPVLLQQVKPEIASLTLGDAARILNNGYPEEGE